MHLKKSLIAALLSLGLAGTACASSLVATTDTLGGALAGTVEGTSDATSSLRDMKQLRAARDDAAAFPWLVVAGVLDDLRPCGFGQDERFGGLGHWPPAIAGITPISSPGLTGVAAPWSLRTFSPLTKTFTKRRISPSASLTRSLRPG